MSFARSAPLSPDSLDSNACHPQNSHGLVTVPKNLNGTATDASRPKKYTSLSSTNMGQDILIQKRAKIEIQSKSNRMNRDSKNLLEIGKRQSSKKLAGTQGEYSIVSQNRRNKNKCTKGKVIIMIQ